MPDIVPQPTAELATARAYAEASTAVNTRRAYRSDWAHWTAWAQARGLEAMPAAPDAFAVYLAGMAMEGLAPSTISRRLAAIGAAHRASGFQSPRGAAEVRAVLSGIRRTHGVAQKRARPVTPEELRAALASLAADGSAIALRDAALLAVGFEGAFRRSELVALEVSDVRAVAEGVLLEIRRSKTDQEGEGRTVGIPTGAAEAALRAWRVAGGVDDGPLFRRVDRWGKVSRDGIAGQTVDAIVKQRLGPEFSGHSLRAGLVTAAARAGKSAVAIMRQTGHRSIAMVARYVRESDLFADNAAGGVL